jgi:opacity protein-like surface antigen
MTKTLLAALLLTAPAMQAFAQSAEQAAQPKRYEHQVGVQMNELIRQVFNFNNSSSANNNPYLLMYSVNSVKTGWGLRLGVGYVYRSFTDDDGITRKESNLNDLRLRLGVEKAFRLSDKWSAGAGLDAICSIDDDKTTTVVRSFDSVKTVTRSNISSFGGGGMAWLRYHITPRVLIGTETSFYYSTGKQDQKVSITQRDFSIPGQPYMTTTSNVNNNTSQGLFSVPIAFYLIVKF